MEEHGTIKHYEILSRLGEGGMGVVYRARDTRLGRVVALKTLHEELARDEERSRRFEREARIISAMSHPGIATLYDFDREGEVAFLAMELIEGHTLRDLLAPGPLAVDRVLDCAVQVAEALAAAHREGVVHRDLKPENIMVAESGYYKVLDFGVARIEPAPAPPDSTPTQTPTLSWATRAGGIVGTVTYMSPEQALGEPVDARSDIFSFGSLLYELLTGRPPFTGNNEIATAQAIVNETPGPMRGLREEIPRGLELVVRKCLAKRPADRYPDAAALAADLHQLQLQSLSGTLSLHGLLAYKTSPDRRRRFRIGIAAGAALALAVAFLIWAPWRGTEPSRPALPAASGLSQREALPAEALPAVASDRPRVVVAFFENNSGDPAADWLSRGLPEMLTTDLSRFGDLDVIATQRLYDLLVLAGRDPNEALDRATTSELARWAGASIVVSGSVFKAGSVYRIDAQAYDAASGTVAVAHKVEGEQLFRMVGDLTAGLRRGLRVASVEGETLQAVTTSSEEAFRLYTSGRAHYDGLMFAEAAGEFERALEADPGFDLARLSLAATHLALGDLTAARGSIEQVVPRGDRMPEADRLLALALRSFLGEGDFAAGSAYFEELVEKFPQDNEAYVLWARALSDLAGEPVQAKRKLRLAQEQEPGNLTAVACLAEQMAKLGEVEIAREMLDEVRLQKRRTADALDRPIERPPAQGS